jgi:2',3'-cyclic-nucleotide 2'-phosphodiesterase (5'-nucleotidase family)
MSISISHVRNVFSFWIMFVALCQQTVLSHENLAHYTIIHTSDVHGWVNGHTHSKSFLNADFGDFLSLVENLQNKSHHNILLFDTGDIIDGTGLSDATPIHGQNIIQVFAKFHRYTAMTVGNHDIERDSSFMYLYTHLIPAMKGRYITSNTLYVNGSEPKWIGTHHRIFRTKTEENILVLGFLFDFDQNAPSTAVIPVSEALQRHEFITAMKTPDIDLIVVLNHIAPQTQTEIKNIYSEIRKYHPNLPLILLTGHSHQKYFSQWDSNCYVLESGKYFEVVGFLEFNLRRHGKVKYIENMTSLWLDTSKSNFYKLTNRTEANFMTESGKKMREMITSMAERLHLNQSLGCSPQFYCPEAALNNTTSFYRLIIENVAPAMLFSAHNLNVQFFVTNTGMLRSPLYRGVVTLDDVWTALPFNNTYYFFPNVTGTVLQVVLSLLRFEPFPEYIRRWTLGWSDSFVSSLLPPWVWSPNITIHSTQLYDVICTEYDSFIIGKLLCRADPNKQWNPQIYPTQLTDTKMLMKYIQRYMPC